VAGRSGVAADHIVDVQVAVSQPPPKVRDSPVFTVRHWHLARHTEFRHRPPHTAVICELRQRRESEHSSQE
jgi:hypothetical protein